MKKLILSLALACAFSFVATSVSARGVIFYSTGEKIEIAEKLPEEFVFQNGEHMNLGVMYEQFSIFWIPVWNYGETKWVYVNDKRDSYDDDVTAEELEMLRTEYGIDIPDEPKIGGWNRVGGKIIWGIIILGLIALWWWTREKKGAAEAAE
jgi:hypothetical protein